MMPTWINIERIVKPDKMSCKNSYLLPEQLNMSAFGTLSELIAYSFSMPVFCTSKVQGVNTAMHITCKCNISQNAKSFNEQIVRLAGHCDEHNLPNEPSLLSKDLSI